MNNLNSSTVPPNSDDNGLTATDLAQAYATACGGSFHGRTKMTLDELITRYAEIYLKCRDKARDLLLKDDSNFTTQQLQDITELMFRCAINEESK